MEIQPTNNGKGDGGRLEGFDVIKTFGLGKPTGIAQYQEIAFPKCGYLIEPNGPKHETTCRVPQIGPRIWEYVYRFWDFAMRS